MLELVLLQPANLEMEPACNFASSSECFCGGDGGRPHLWQPTKAKASTGKICCNQQRKKLLPKSFLATTANAEVATGRVFFCKMICSGRRQGWNQHLGLLQPANSELEPACGFAAFVWSVFCSGDGGRPHLLQPTKLNASTDEIFCYRGTTPDDGDHDEF